MFFWYDYVLLVITLLISTLIGLHFGCFRNRPTTVNEYLSGGKRMNILPIALSVTVSHFSAIILIGLPADVYKYGAYFLWMCLSAVIFTILSIYIYYVPLFKWQVVSIFEYLEKRFDHKIRVMASVMYIVSENLLLAIVIYSPALALSVVTGINLGIICVVISGICIFYTAIGGLRTVVWTDIFQFLIVVSTFFTICGFGIKSVGGLSTIWNAAVRGGRLDIFDFDIDPTKRDSFWISVIGYTPRLFYFFCLSQSSIQKYLSLPTLRDCRRAFVTATLCWIAVHAFAIFLGLLVYAVYKDCDPVLDKKIKKYDQIVPYYVSQITSNMPGISGLFMAALTCAAISTLSSSLNALSGVIYKDIICKFSTKEVTETRKVTILKLLVISEGVICTVLALFVQHLGDIFPLIMSLTSAVDGPLLGLFTLAILFRKTSTNGALFGTIGGIIFMAVIYFSSVSYRHRYPTKPFSVDGCDLVNTSLQFPSNLTVTETTESKPFYLFRISHNYYCFLGAMVTIIVGLIVTYSTKTPKSSETTNSPAYSLVLKNDNSKECETLED